MRDTLAGVLQTLGTVLAFVLAGVAAGALYPSAMTPHAPPDPTDPVGGDAEHWLVDGYNVIQVALLAGRARDDWWVEARRAELLERADTLQAGSVADARDGAIEVEVVFDGREPARSREGARAVFAASADDWILARVAERRSETAPPTVVTGDRRLASRARSRGARVVTPAEFLARCES